MIPFMYAWYHAYLFVMHNIKYYAYLFVMHSIYVYIILCMHNSQIHSGRKQNNAF